MLAAEVTVLLPGEMRTIEGARIAPSGLQVPRSAVRAATGFRLEERGLCSGEVCIPLDPSWLVVEDDTTWFDVSAFAQSTGRAQAREGSAFSFGAAPALRETTLLAGQAPDFELEDRDGNALRLSDLRGSKVLLLTWASW